LSPVSGCVAHLWKLELGSLIRAQYQLNKTQLKECVKWMSWWSCACTRTVHQMCIVLSFSVEEHEQHLGVRCASDLLVADLSQSRSCSSVWELMNSSGVSARCTRASTRLEFQWGLQHGLQGKSIHWRYPLSSGFVVLLTASLSSVPSYWTKGVHVSSGDQFQEKVSRKGVWWPLMGNDLFMVSVFFRSIDKQWMKLDQMQWIT
jgi:hypothetical protein